MRFCRVHPVIVRTCIGLIGRAQEGQVFDACHVGRVRAVQVAVRIALLVESDHIAGFQHLVDKSLIFFIGAIAPIHLVRLRQFGNFLNPFLQGCVSRAHNIPRPSKRLSIQTQEIL